MAASLRALLTGIIDYAGIFPPANLSLERAVRNYARHRKGEDAWMLGRFIILAARLGELAAFEKLWEEGPPFVFSALGRGGKTGEEFLEGMEADLADIAEFRKRHAGRVEVDVLEVKLPDDLVLPENYQTACYTLTRAAEMIERQGPPVLTPFYEAGLTGNWRGILQSTVAVLRYMASYAQTRMVGRYTHYRPAGFKLRCGGVKGAAVPSPEQVANVIVACRDAGIAWKATAGLHHPLRRSDGNEKAHGFLNLFVAATLAAAQGLDQGQVQDIVKDEEVQHFAFDDDGLRWCEWEAKVGQIATARRQFAVGFGSCSFDEPREDLRALQLL